MLSQIERSEANPTFAVLWSLTRALKIEFSDLVDPGASTSTESIVTVVTASNTPQMRNSDQSCLLRILSPPEMAGKTEWYEIELSPMGTLDSAAHAAGAVEHLTAFTSGLQVTSGGHTTSLRTGETARYPVDVPHQITNTSRKVARGLMVLLYR